MDRYLSYFTSRDWDIGVYNLHACLIKKGSRYYVFDKNGKILIITTNKRIAIGIHRKNNGKKSNRKTAEVS